MDCLFMIIGAAAAFSIDLTSMVSIILIAAAIHAVSIKMTQRNDSPLTRTDPLPHQSSQDRWELSFKYSDMGTVCVISGNSTSIHDARIAAATASQFLLDNNKINTTENTTPILSS